MAGLPHGHVRRTVLAGGPLVFATVMTLVLYFLWLPRLPERLNSHAGTQDFISRGMYPFVLPPLMLAIALLLGGMAVMRADAPRVQRGLATAGGATGGMMLIAGAVIPWNNLDVTDPTTVRFPVWQIGVLFAMTAVGAVGGWFGAGRMPQRTTTRPEPARPRQPVRELATDEAVTWRRVVVSRQIGWLLVLFLPLAVIITIVTLGWGLLLLVPLYVLLGACTRAEVVVDDEGLTVRLLGGVFRVRVPVGEIRSASSREIDAMRDFGGAGWQPSSQAVGLILRSGPGLWVDRACKGTLAVTVADADEAAALLNGLRDRNRLSRA